MSSTLGIFEPFEYDGEVYQIARRTFRTEALFETWLKKQARDDLRALWADLPEYTEMLRLFQQDCAAQVYAFTSWNSLRAQASLPGIKERCYLDLLQANPRRVTREVIDRLFTDPDGQSTGKTLDDGSPEVETYADELVRRLREANAPPLSKMAATTTNGTAPPATTTERKTTTPAGMDEAAALSSPTAGP